MSVKCRYRTLAYALSHARQGRLSGVSSEFRHERHNADKGLLYQACELRRLYFLTSVIREIHSDLELRVAALVDDEFLA